MYNSNVLILHDPIQGSECIPKALVLPQNSVLLDLHKDCLWFWRYKISVLTSLFLYQTSWGVFIKELRMSFYSCSNCSNFCGFDYFFPLWFCLFVLFGIKASTHPLPGWVLSSVFLSLDDYFFLFLHFYVWCFGILSVFFLLRFALI